MDNHYSPYDVAGPGDISISGMYNLSTGLFGWGKKDTSEKSGENNDKTPAPSFLRIFAGLGVKTASARNNVHDDYGNLIPANYQPGTGMHDFLINVFCTQDFGLLTPYASMSYTLTGPENDQEYERSDKLNLSLGCRYTVDSKYSGKVMFAILATNIFDNDVYLGTDLETCGTFTYYQVGYTMNPVDHMDMSLIIQMPLTSPDTSGGGDTAEIDYQIMFTLGYRF